MSVRFVRGSLFDSDAQTLVNPVNRVGVSGAGLAKEFKKRYPNMHRDYALACKNNAMGNLRISWRHPHDAVLCFVTKEHWRDPSRLELIEAGLEEFVRSEWVRNATITSIAFPALGCGNGGLDWLDVQPLMTRYLEKVDIPVAIHVPMSGAQ